MSKFFLLPVLALVLSCQLRAQSDSTKHQLNLGAYASAYYAARTTNGSGSNLEPFLSVGPRDENFGLNVAELSAAYEGPNVRANIGLHYGDLPQSSWSSTFTNIQQANAGVRLAEGFWVDAGFFLTHIGYESILPRQKYLSSTAYLSWNEPFYQSGLRLSYSPNDRWSFQGWLLNGYNSFVDNNSAKSVGASITYQPSEATSITYNNLFGNEGGDDDEDPTQFRTVQNVYWTQSWTDRFTSVLNLTGAAQSDSQFDNPNEMAVLYGAYLTLDYAVADNWNLTARAETYHDESGFVSGRVPAVNRPEGIGLQVSAFTLSGQYRPTADAYVRVETRYARQADDIALFQKDGLRVDGRLEFLFTMGVAFDYDRAWR